MLLGEQIGTTTLQSQRSAGSEANMDTLITNKGVILAENLIDHGNGGGATSWPSLYNSQIEEEVQKACEFPNGSLLSLVLFILYGWFLSASPWLHPDSKSTLLTQSLGVTVLSNILQHTYDPTVALLDTAVTEMNAYVHQEKVADHSIFSCEKRKHKCQQSAELQFGLYNVIM